jgi:hypothetical protein
MQSSAMKSVFLVETPLSYINALEAQNHFGIKRDQSILVLTTIWDKNLEQIKGMLDENQWTEVIFLNYELKNGKHIGLFQQGRLKRYISFRQALSRINKLASRIGQIDYLLSGYYTHELILHFANKIKYKEFVLIDDGTMTMSTNSVRLHEKDRNFKKTLLYNGRLKADYKLYLKYLLGLKDNGIPSVTFFTVFDLQVNPFDQVIKNELTFLGTQIEVKAKTDKVFFLGSPLAESLPNAIDIDYFEVLIRKIVEMYGAEQFVYFPHRNETLEVVNKVQKELQFEIRKIGVPFEYYLGQTEYAPKKIVSCFTSALFNLPKIIPADIQVEAIRIPDDQLVENVNKINIIEIYKEIASKKDIVTIEI